MQTFPIIFHDWQGHAVRADGHWWIAPRQVSDYLGLSWARQQRKISGSNLRKGTALRAVPSAGGEQQMLTLKLAHFAHWLLGISSRNAPEHKRERLDAMQEALLDAIERQLECFFGLPGLTEAKDFADLPQPPVILSRMTTEEVRLERETVLDDPMEFQTARLLRIGLPATRVAPAVGCSVYRARQRAKRYRQIGLVPPSWRERKLCQPDLFDA